MMSIFGYKFYPWYELFFFGEILRRIIRSNSISIHIAKFLYRKIKIIYNIPGNRKKYPSHPTFTQLSIIILKNIANFISKKMYCFNLYILLFVDWDFPCIYQLVNNNNFLLCELSLYDLCSFP